MQGTVCTDPGLAWRCRLTRGGGLSGRRSSTHTRISSGKARPPRRGERAQRPFFFCAERKRKRRTHRTPAPLRLARPHTTDLTRPCSSAWWAGRRPGRRVGAPSDAGSAARRATNARPPPPPRVRPPALMASRYSHAGHAHAPRGPPAAGSREHGPGGGEGSDGPSPPPLPPPARTTSLGTAPTPTEVWENQRFYGFGWYVRGWGGIEAAVSVPSAAVASSSSRTPTRQKTRTGKVPARWSGRPGPTRTGAPWKA
jgi:hypothetical protein